MTACWVVEEWTGAVANGNTITISSRINTFSCIRFKPWFSASLHKFFCWRKTEVGLRKVYIFIAVNTVLSQSSRNIYSFLWFSAVVEPRLEPHKWESSITPFPCISSFEELHLDGRSGSNSVFRCRDLTCSGECWPMCCWSCSEMKTSEFVMQLPMHSAGMLLCWHQLGHITATLCHSFYW